MRPLRAFLAGVLISGFLVGGFIAIAQTETVLGEIKNLSRIWDGTDVALVSAGGALLTDASATTQPISAASLPLPTGAATAANQLPDGHNVTVDNGAGAAAVNIQDGGNAITVDGTVTVGVFPDNEPFNVAQWNGVAPTAAAALADNQGNPTAPHVGAFNSLWDGAAWDRWPGTSADGGEVQVTVFPDNEPINQAQRGGVAVVAGACERETLLYAQIDQTGGEQIITGTASERIYICSFQVVSATAQNVALVDGTGSVCATAPTGLLGGSTAATGWNFAANGGIVLPPSRDSWTKTSTDADNVCLLQSGAGQVSGSLTYISIPNI